MKIEHQLAPEGATPISEHQKDPDFPADYAICDDGSAYGESSQKIDPGSANGRLLAAAPDLLSALENARKYVAFAFDQGVDGAEQAGLDLDAAIKKARGE